MRVSIDWLKELVEIKDTKEVVMLLPLRTIALKEVTDSYIELDMKGYNRADLLSMRGVAREVAAITDSKIKFEEKKSLIFSDKKIPDVSIKVENQNLCSFYSLTKIGNLKVEQSGDPWVQKLSNSGIRSINNVADVTNLTMLEFGQPMHAFDASKIKGVVSVRLAKKGEQLLTLDGKQRILDSEDLVIADENGPIGLAGVMGGKDTEVSDSTSSILLEAAIFDPVSIRKTAQRHNLTSEASKRFQHGLTKTNLLQALTKAIEMYEGLAGKLTAISLVGDLEDKSKTILLTQKKINSLIGVDIPAEQVESSLKNLGFSLASHSSSGNVDWEVTVPYWRLDIEIEVDLTEEIARMYGYEKIPAKPLKGKLPEKIDQSLPNFIYDLKKTLADTGLTEVQTYSFFSTDVLNNLGYEKSELVKIANPISSETEYMRNHLWPNLVEVVGKNMRNGFKDIAIFEIGKVYSPQKGTLPNENYRLAITLMNGTDNPTQELNAIIAGVKDLDVELGKEIGESAGRFHPTRYLYLNHNGKPIGKIGEVHPRVLNKLGIEKRIAILEIDLENLI